MSRISVPTTARLPSSLRVDSSNPIVSKVLNRLSRQSLISLAIEWLDESHLPLAAPYLRDDDDNEYDDYESDFYPPESSPEALQDEYRALQSRKGSKREILDRITTGDWRHGLTLYQLAMADLQYLYDHPTSQKWTAYRIVPLKPPTDPDGGGGEGNAPEADKTSLVVPPFHPSVFLKSLQTQILPDVKAHYNFDRHKTLPLLILRIFILDSPYNTNLALSGATPTTTTTTTTTITVTTRFETARTIYVCFPDASPHIFISKPQSAAASSSDSAAAGAAAAASAGESKSLRNLIVEGIPKALSRPNQRFALLSTALATRNLEEMLDRRGSGRTNSAGGGWSIYAAAPDEKVSSSKKESPLSTVLPSPPLSEDDPITGAGVGVENGVVSKGQLLLMTESEKGEEQASRRMRLVARARFGETARVDDKKGVERVDLVLEDEFSPGFEKSRAAEKAGGDSDGRGQAGGRAAKPGRIAGRKSKAGVDLDRMDIDGEEEEEDDEDEDEENEEDGDDGLEKNWRPYVRLTFHGSHVFAGIRQLVEAGVIDGEQMPGWMTGEEGVTMGAVRNGRIRGHKGSGL